MADSEPGREPDPVLDAFFTLMDRLRGRGEAAARRHQLSTPALMALTQLTGAMPMKDLGEKLGCERSFVTAIADELEGRELVRREPGRSDRRVKNLVLTSRGAALREQLDRELYGRMPWRHALDDAERAALLSLLGKLLAAEGPR